MDKIDLRNVVVNYQYRSAHQVLWDMCLKLGVENVHAALDEVDAEQNAHLTGGESPVEVDLSTLENKRRIMPNLITTSKSFLEWVQSLPHVVIPAGLESDMQEAIAEAEDTEQRLSVGVAYWTCPNCRALYEIELPDVCDFCKTPRCAVSTTPKQACLYPVFDDNGRDVGCDRFAVVTYKKIPVCVHHAEIMVRKSGGTLWINFAEHGVEPTIDNAGDFPAVVNQSESDSPA